MAIVYENYVTGDDNWARIVTSSWYGQSFRPVTSHTVTYLRLKIGKDGTPPADMTVELYLADGAGKPTGSRLAFGTVTDGDISAGTGGEWHSIALDTGVALTAGSDYVFYCKTTSGGAGQAFVLRYDQSGATYTVGDWTWTTTSGSSWTVSSGADAVFSEWGTGAASTPVDKTYTKMLVAIAGNEFWYESSAGTMTRFTAVGPDDLDAAVPLTMVEAFQKVFVANGSNLWVADFSNVKIATTDLNTHAPDPGTILTGGSSGAVMVVEYITSTTADAACTIYGKRTTDATFTSGETVTGKDGVNNDGNDITFAISANEVAGPFWYVWTVFGQDATFGTMPPYATIVSLYRGRVTLAGNKYEPHMWYQFRVSDPFDLQTESTDAKAAVAGNDARLGKIGDVVTATVPIDRDNWLIGSTGEMWLFTGDGAEGANLDRISKTTGMFGTYAHCIDDEGNVYFWGTNGLYTFSLPGGTPRCISRIRLPNIVKDGVGGTAVTQSSHRIVMAHDSRRKGILVFITTLADGTNANYFYDLTTKAFFPESYPDECGVFSAFYYDATDPDYRVLILGGNDGYLRFFDDSAVDDDAGDSGDTAINSYVALGPIALSQDPGKEGTFTGLDFVSAGGASGGSQSDSSDVGYSVFAAPSAEEVIEKLSANTGPNFAGTFTAPGRRHGSRRAQKISAVSFGVRLFNSTAAETWGFEKLFGDILPSGRFK